MQRKGKKTSENDMVSKKKQGQNKKEPTNAELSMRALQGETAMESEPPRKKNKEK